jgi:hypothetical protein
MGDTLAPPTRETGSGRAPSVRQYRIFDEYLLVMSESNVMSEQIHTFLQTLEVREPAWSRATLRLMVFQAPRAHVVLCCPEAGVAKVFPAGREAWAGFRRFLLNFCVSKSHGFYPMHACAVGNRQNEAALLSGTTMAGKTTLTAELLRRGYKFLCDDTAQLTDRGEVIAFPTGSTISERTFQFVPELGVLRSETCRVGSHKDREWVVNFGAVFPTAPAYEPVAVSAFFFITAAFGEESKLEVCSRDEAVWHFQNARMSDRLILPPLIQGAAPAYYQSFQVGQKCLERAPFFTVRNGNIADTADWIQSRFPLDGVCRA